MRATALLIIAACLLVCRADVFAGEYDATQEFMCGDQVSDYWSYAAYRESDGEYRDLAYGRVPIIEISKYGADAFYLPDGDQELRPFFVRMGDRLLCSPSFEGQAYDASLIWKSPVDGKAVVTGFADMIGKVASGKASGSVSVRLLIDGKEVWAGEAGPEGQARFSETLDLVKDGKVELRIANGPGGGPKVTEVNLHVSVP